MKRKRTDDDTPEVSPGVALADYLAGIQKEVVDATGCTEDEASDHIDAVIDELIGRGEIDLLPETDDPNHPEVGAFFLATQELDLRKKVFDAIPDEDD